MTTFQRRRKRLSNRPRGFRQHSKNNRLVLPILCAVGLGCLACMALLVQKLSNSNSSISTRLVRHRHRPSRVQAQQEDEEQQENDDWPFVHIVNTRFMQEQGNLTTLGRARLHLFETFCLPTMVHQSSQDFLWIIKTDPSLDKEIRRDMVNLLKEYPNFYLVGSNQNYQIGKWEGSWRDGLEGRDVLNSPIYTGNVKRLQQAHDNRNSHFILETRLDADDGLHRLYLEYIQVSAQKYLKNYQWLYWCSRRHLEWYAASSVEKGLLNTVEHEKLCVTPGITVGFPVGVVGESVPQYAHHVLYKEIEANGGCTAATDDEENLECIRLVEDLSFVALRSRTPTSAGMMDTVLEHQHFDKKGVALIWKALQKIFYISPDKAKETNRYIHEHLVDIAKENLKGQCTTGHSCKNSSVAILKRIVEEGRQQEVPKESLSSNSETDSGSGQVNHGDSPPDSVSSNGSEHGDADDSRPSETE